LEGRAGQPKMMSVGLHCRLSRPARVAALAEFVDYAKSYGREVWITTRESIANHWYENHLPRGCGNPIIPEDGGAIGGGALNGLTLSSSSPSSYGSGNGNGNGSTEKKAASSSSRFSFLGNLKAPRNSEEFKQSLQKNKDKSADDEEEDGDDGDVI